MEFEEVIAELFGADIAKAVKAANLEAKEKEYVVPVPVTADHLISLWNFATEAGIEGYKSKVKAGIVKGVTYEPVI